VEDPVKKVILLVVAAVVLLGLAGCAPGPNSFVNTPGEKGYVPGFWYGLWNGVISPVTFIISLFNRNVSPYEVHNSGGWYNFGFMLGVSIIFGGGAGSTAARRKRQ
jgi:hypothetical protein